LLEFPVWAWQWATPSDLGGATSWRTSALSPQARRAKRAALECFPSQSTDQFGAVIVDAVAMERFQRSFEVFAHVG
jgi:hypothetical protein